MELTLSGYSTALFATWYFVEELGLLFDAGDGVAAALLQKSRKASHVFLSHADRDHLAGLLQFNQLNARPGAPVLHYPRDCGSFPALAAFTAAFDPHVAGALWKPVLPGERIPVRKDLYVEALENGHVAAAEGQVKSLSYKLFETRRKLRAEYAALPPVEIRRLSAELGREAMSEEQATCVLGYSGDTPVEDPARWQDCRILIHEATFLGGAGDAGLRTHGNRHSRLDEVIEMLSGSRVEQLVLGHFSSRYAPAAIDAAIRNLCDRYALNIPVFRLLPGQVVYDILRGTPING